MKVYIAGAITNNPDYQEQFGAAEKRLKAQGHDVFNPARNQGYTYREYINMGLFELMHCDAIYLLKGYENSTGATLEHDYARTVGIEIMLEEDEDINPDDVTVEAVYKSWLRTAEACNEIDQKIKDIVTESLRRQIPLKPKLWVSDKNVQVGAALFGAGCKLYKCQCGCGQNLPRWAKCCPESGQRIDWAAGSSTEEV